MLQITIPSNSTRRLQERSIPPLTSLVPPLGASDTAGATSQHDAAFPGDRDLVWSFLRSSTVPTLRTYCKDYNVVQKGRKLEMQVHLFEKLCQGSDTSTIWSTVPNSPSCTEGHKAFHEWISTRVSSFQWHLAPQVQAEDTNGNTLIRGFSSVFTTNEFARLIVLIATNDTLREALLRSGLELSRNQLDQRMSRDAFWVSTIAPVFNDLTERPVFDFFGPLTGVNPALSPSVSRTGQELRTQYVNARSDFTKAYNNYKRSGENSTDFETF